MYRKRKTKIQYRLIWNNKRMFIRAVCHSIYYPVRNKWIDFICWLSFHYRVKIKGYHPLSYTENCYYSKPAGKVPVEYAYCEKCNKCYPIPYTKLSEDELTNCTKVTNPLNIDAEEYAKEVGENVVKIEPDPEGDEYVCPVCKEYCC